MRIPLLAVVISLLPAPALSAPDPFLGEGKENYIKRCIATAEVPKNVGKAKFCRCFADGLEKEYPSAVALMGELDLRTATRRTLSDIQEQIDKIAEKVAKGCAGF